MAKACEGPNIRPVIPDIAGRMKPSAVAHDIHCSGAHETTLALA